MPEPHDLATGTTEGCVDDHGATEAEVGPGDVEERVVLEGQDDVAIERVGLAVALIDQIDLVVVDAEG